MDRYIDDEDREVIRHLALVLLDRYINLVSVTAKENVLDAYTLLEEGRNHFRRKYYESPLRSK